MQVIQRIFAIVVLLAVLVGIPVALAFTIGTPLSWRVPSVDELRTILTVRASSATLVHIIAGLAWLVWAHFVVCIAVELVNVTLRQGLPALRVPFAGATQGVARRLVAAAVLGAVAGPLAMGAAQAAPLEQSSTHGASLSISVPGAETAYATSQGAGVAVSSVTGVRPVMSAEQVAPPSVATAVEVATLRYVVQPPAGSDYDCLWDIAERHLGDATRWKEILFLNQSDPTSATITDPDHIEPGWLLTMPADAVDLPAVSLPSGVAPGGAVSGPEGDPAPVVPDAAAQTLAAEPDAPVESPASEVAPGGAPTAAELVEQGHLPQYENGSGLGVDLPGIVADAVQAIPGVGADAAPEAGAQVSVEGAAEQTPGSSEAGGSSAGVAASGIGPGDEPAPGGAVTGAVESVAELLGPDVLHPDTTAQLSQSVTPEGPSTPDAAESAGAPEQTSAPESPSAADPATPLAEQPAPQGPAVAAPALPADQIPTASASAPVHAKVDQVAEHVLSNKAMYVVGCGVAGVLAAGFMTALITRRNQQRARRLPGQRIVLPAALDQEIETQFRSINPTIPVASVDAVLRNLAAQLRHAGQGFPALHGVYVDPDRVDLFCTNALDPVMPWRRCADEPLHWTTEMATESAAPPVNREVADRPYPALIVVGQSDTGGLLLVDLETIGSLGFTGPMAVAAAAQTAAVCELLTSPWTADCHITLVGETHAGLSELAQDSRVRRSADLAAELVRVRRHAENVSRILAEDGFADVGQARSARSTRDVWSPQVLVLQGDLDPEHRDALTQLLTDHPHGGVVVLTAGCAPLGRWAVQFDEHATEYEPGSDEPLSALFLPAGTPLWPQVLPTELVGYVRSLLDTTTEPAVAGPDWAVDIAPVPAVASVLPDNLAVPGHEDVTPIAAGTGGREVVADVALTTDPVSGDPVVVTTPHGAGTDAADAVGVVESGPGGSVVAPAPAPKLLLLGEVTVADSSGVSPRTAGHDHCAVVAELLTFMHLSPEPATAAVIKGALRSRAGRWTDRLLSTRTAMARAWLGEDADQNPYLPLTRDAEPYVLSAAVSSDWVEFEAALQPSIGQKTYQELLVPLRLVRGEPLGGEPAIRFAWAEQYRQNMIQAIVDVAHECVTKALAAHDVAAAREAAAIGRMVDPHAELMWQHSLRIEWADGQTSKAEHLIAELTKMATDTGQELSAETTTLVKEIETGLGVLAS